MSTDLPKPFDINEGVSDGGAQWPVLDGAFTAADYADVFMKGAAASSGPGTLKAFLDDTIATMKASPAGVPPEMVTFAHMSIVPDPNGRNVLPVPGIPPQMIQKIMVDHLLPKLVVNMRVSDVMRYSDHSTHVWKPGWTIDLREGDAHPTDEDRAHKKAARDFLLNCTTETVDPRKRDAARLTNFKTFLASLVRDSMTYDGIAIWTDNDLRGRTRSFKALSAYNIRLCTAEGYCGDPNIFAVGVDESNNIREQFTRHDLIWYVRNPRADARVGGYGYPEIDQALRLVQAFSDMFDMNAQTFNKNGIPNGLLKVSGMWNQRQLDVLSRIWQNLKRGVSKSWALPVLPIPKDGDIELLDLAACKGEDVRYSDFANMLAGAYCALCSFPVERLGYRVSGAGPDNRMDEGKGAAAKVDIADPGLMPLLTTVETVVNEYLLWPRWPDLVFRFNGKNPTEDAREYQLKTLSMTVDERRAYTDEPTLEEAATDPTAKEIARIMGACPTDPGLAGVYQSIATAIISAKANVAETVAKPGAVFAGQKDPAKSEEHGHTGGVRRNSAAEAASAASTT